MLPTGRRIAVDYGDARVGVAISDVSAILATPFKTLNPENAFDALVKFVAEESVAAIYIGLPLNLSGKEGESAEKAKHFAHQLRTQMPKEIVLCMIDERLSTKSAAHKVLQSGGKVEKASIDQLAAVEILETALNIEKTTGKWAGYEI